MIHSILTITVSDDAGRLWLALAVSCAATGAVCYVWRWRPVHWLGISAHGEVYVDAGYGRQRAIPLPPSIMSARWCYLQLRADNRTWHVLLRRGDNTVLWRFAQVLWRWHPQFDR